MEWSSFTYPLRSMFISQLTNMGQMLGILYCLTLALIINDDSFGDEMGKLAGLSLHVGVVAKVHERKKLERLCRYISRPGGVRAAAGRCGSSHRRSSGDHDDSILARKQCIHAQLLHPLFRRRCFPAPLLRDSTSFHLV